MMRTSTIVALCCLFSTLSIAQPVITASFIANEGFTFTNVTAVERDVEPGPAGANQTWNFSFVTPDQMIPMISFEYVDPKTTPFADKFPNSNLALIPARVGDTSFITYYRFTNNELFLEGNASPVNETIYSDPQKIMQFPFGFGDSFEDLYKATNTISDLMSHVRGMVAVEADGYGSLVLPDATYSNILRVKSQETRVDSTSVGGGVSSLIETMSTNYFWFDPASQSALATLTTTKTNTITILPGMNPIVTEGVTTTIFSYSTDFTSSAPDLTKPADFVVETYGPNPVRSDLNITLYSPCRCSTKMLIVSSEGKVVAEEHISLFEGSNLLRTDMSRFPVGIYQIFFYRNHSQLRFAVLKQ